MNAPAINFAALMPKVAKLLLDEPNQRLSCPDKGRLRFGTHGSMEIDTGEGWFDDHEANVRGGVLELIQHKRGCNMHGALSWLEEQGLKQRDAAITREHARTFYDYRDASGEVAYRVERRGKDAVPPFLQHGPDGSGGFRSARGCMHGVASLPYRLPELLAADPSAIIFICEGEKDADRLAREGLVATTNSGGAGKFGAELAPHFAGRRVVVLADNDDAGERHAIDVEAKLRAVALKIAVLRLPGLSAKGDVSDWLRSRGAFNNTVADLMSLAEAALSSPAVNNWPALDLSACAKQAAPPREWVVEGWAPAHKATLVAGDGGIGKSLLEQMEATCVAAGLPFLGLQTRQMVAAYCSWEDDADELWRRQEAICSVLGIRMANLAGKLHLVSFTEAETPFLVTTCPDKGGVRVTPLGREIERLVEAHSIGFLILDNASQIAGIDHNAVEEVAPFAHWLGTIAKRCNGAVLLLHHTNKAGDDWLGSVAYNNQFRSRRLLARPADCHDPDLRVLSNPKANYARAGGEITLRWFNGAFVRDEDLPDDKRVELALAARDGADNAVFLACLRVRNEQRRAVSEKVSPTYAPKVFVEMPESKSIGKRRLEHAMDRLFRIGAIERAHLWDGLDRKPVHGLRETAGNPENGCGQHCAGEVQATAGDLRAATVPNTHTIYKYIDAAAPAGAPPSGAMILAPGEAGDEVDLGFGK